MKFDKLVNQILNEDFTNQEGKYPQITPEQLLSASGDSVAYVAGEGIDTRKGGNKSSWVQEFMMPEEGEEQQAVADFLDGAVVQVMPFKAAATQVVNYAKEEEAGAGEVKKLVQALKVFGAKHKGKKFFTFGLEADWGIGTF